MANSLIKLSLCTLALGSTVAPFVLKEGELLELRIFIDKNMIEVFANERQSIVFSHRPAAGESGVALLCDDGEVRMQEGKVWRMRSIYESP